MSVDAETRNGSAAATAGASALSSWRDGAAVEAILEFVGTRQADRDGWMVVSVTDDWARVF
jgi:hypothetical protein